MAWRCAESNFKSLGSQEPHQRHPHPPSPDWILGGLVVPEAPSGGKKWPMVTFSNIMKSRIHVNQSFSGEGAKIFFCSIFVIVHAENI